MARQTERFLDCGTRQTVENCRALGHIKVNYGKGTFVGVAVSARKRWVEAGCGGRICERVVLCDMTHGAMRVSRPGEVLRAGGLIVGRRRLALGIRRGAAELGDEQNGAQTHKDTSHANGAWLA